MPNFARLGFVDCSTMAGWLQTKYSVHFADDKRRQESKNSAHHDTESIILRGPPEPMPENWFLDGDHENKPLLNEWASARRLLAKIKTTLAANPGLPYKGRLPTFGKVMIVRLKPQGFVDWHTDEGEYAEAHDRVHLCLVPAENAWLYSGGESISPTGGHLWWVNNRIAHSAANFGDSPRIHLIADIRKPEHE